jgi:hypothetical protein
VAEERKGEQGGSVPEALRTAVERTLSVIGSRSPLGSGPAATRERAQELLDEVARRGQEAREEIERRVRRASGEDVGALERRLEALERRVSRLEAGREAIESRSGREGSNRKLEG